MPASLPPPLLLAAHWEHCAVQSVQAQPNQLDHAALEVVGAALSQLWMHAASTVPHLLTQTSIVSQLESPLQVLACVAQSSALAVVRQLWQAWGTLALTSRPLGGPASLLGVPPDRQAVRTAAATLADPTYVDLRIGLSLPARRLDRKRARQASCPCAANASGPALRADGRREPDDEA